MRLFGIILVVFGAVVGLGTALVHLEDTSSHELSADLGDFETQGESEQETEDERDDDDANPHEFANPLASNIELLGTLSEHQGEALAGTPPYRPPIA